MLKKPGLQINAALSGLWVSKGKEEVKGREAGVKDRDETSQAGGVESSRPHPAGQWAAAGGNSFLPWNSHE